MGNKTEKKDQPTMPQCLPPSNKKRFNTRALSVHIRQRTGNGLYLWSIVDDFEPRWLGPLMSGSANTYALAAECAKVAYDDLMKEEKDV